MQKKEILASFEKKTCACGKTHKEAAGASNPMGHFWFDCPNCGSCLLVLKGKWQIIKELFEKPEITP